MSKYTAYHRTSTTSQHLERGVMEIEKFCKERCIELWKNKVYTDQKTGKDFNRPAYQILKQEVLETGDTLIITEVDRLGRNKNETLRELRYFQNMGVRVIVLEIPTTCVDYSAYQSGIAEMLMETINNMLIEMFASLAEAELKKREKRQREGIEAMKVRGEWDNYGRPRVMELEEFRKEYLKVEIGVIRAFDLMRQLGMSKGTYYRYIAELKKSEEKENNKKQDCF